MNELTHEASAGVNEATGKWLAHILVRGFDEEADAKAWVQEFNNIGVLAFEEIVSTPERTI